MMGYLSTAPGSVDANLRRAMVYGSVVASFCCEDFGLKSTTRVTRAAIETRFKELEKVDPVLGGGAEQPHNLRIRP